MTSLFKGKTVAFSGQICPSDKTRILTYLKQCGGKIVIYASNIDFLIVGSDYLEKYKYKSCRGHVLPFQKVLETIPVIPTMLWVDCYKPKGIGGIIGQRAPIAALTSWLSSWNLAEDSPRAALVTGPPGIGKTTTVHIIVRDLGYDLIELNASNERSASAIRGWFDEALRSQCVGRRRVVVMDEVDGMSSGDRGGVAELGRIVRSCAFPIICIANERTPRMRPLSSHCLDIRFQRPTRVTIASALMPIVLAHKLNITLSGLEKLCEQNGNDIRSILNYLQFSSIRPCSSSSASAGSSAKDELLRIDTFSAAGRLFSKSGTLDSRSNLVFIDFGMVPLMVGEGYIGAAAKSGGTDAEKLKRCALSADFVGDWDILDTRIRRTQNWSLLPAATVFVAGAAYSTEGSAPFNIFPTWLGKNSKRMKHMRNLREIQHRLTGNFLDRLDILRSRLFAPGLTAEQIVIHLDGLGLTRDDMLETMVDLAYSDNEIVMDGKLKSAVTREWKKRHAEDIKKGVSEETSEEIVDDENESVDFVED